MHVRVGNVAREVSLKDMSKIDYNPLAAKAVVSFLNVEFAPLTKREDPVIIVRRCACWLSSWPLAGSL